MVAETTTVRAEARRYADVYGFWAALLAALLAVLFAVLSVVFVPAPWTGIEAYARGFDARHMSSFVPALLLAPTLVVLMASIHVVTPAEKQTLSLVALAFTTVYAAMVCTNYYVQLFAVRLSLLHGELDGVALLAMPNLHSIFFALEAIGYAFLSLATAVVSPTFVGGRLERWIRLLFWVNGALGILGSVVAPWDRPTLIFAGLGLWNLVFPAAMLLVALHFRKRRGSV